MVIPGSTSAALSTIYTTHCPLRHHHCPPPSTTAKAQRRRDGNYGNRNGRHDGNGNSSLSCTPTLPSRQIVVLVVVEVPAAMPDQRRRSNSTLPSTKQWGSRAVLLPRAPAVARVVNLEWADVLIYIVIQHVNIVVMNKFIIFHKLIN